MRVFIWESVGHCTTSYHNGGAVLVVAETLDRAREFFRKDNAYVPTLEKCDVFTSDPDHIIEALSTEQEKSLVFPDQGCC